MKDGEFVLTPSSNLVSFNNDKVTPPSQLYLQRDDVLAVLVATSQINEIITVSGRLLQPGGRILYFSQSFPITAASRTVQQFTFQLSEGWLLGVAATAAVATSRGQTFVRLYVTRGATAVPLTNVAQVLAADYVTQNNPNGYPYGRIASPLEGTGAVLTSAPSNPAAGADYNIAVPTGARWRVTGFSAIFTTSVTAGNRQVALSVFRTASAATQFYVCQNLQAACLGYTYYWIPGYTNAIFAATQQLMFLSPELYIAQTGSIRTLTSGKNAADQWSSGGYNVEEWLDV